MITDRVRHTMGLTDLDRLKKAYNRLHLDFLVWQDDYKNYHLTLDCGVGVEYLYIDFQFDKDKKFLSYGIWQETIE